MLEGMSQKLPFKMRAGEPTVIEVQTKDGKKWELSVVLAVFEVRTSEKKTPTGVPAFDVRANVAVDTREKE